MILSHLKIAWKVLLRRKFFTFVSLFGTAFTLVVLMVIVAMMDGFLSPGGPEVNLDRTLFISRMAMRGAENEWTGNPGYGFLDKYCRDIPGVLAMSIYTEPGTSTTFLKLASRPLVSVRMPRSMTCNRMLKMSGCAFSTSSSSSTQCGVLTIFSVSRPPWSKPT